jgi:hypothetical protein
MPQYRNFSAITITIRSCARTKRSAALRSPESRKQRASSVSCSRASGGDRLATELR